MLDSIQAWQLICSLLGLVLTRKWFAQRMQRWGYLALFAAQPAWIHSAWVTYPFQWGTFTLVMIYTLLWACAAWDAWMVKR